MNALWLVTLAFISATDAWFGFWWWWWCGWMDCPVKKATHHFDTVGCGGAQDVRRGCFAYDDGVDLTTTNTNSSQR